MNVAQSDSLKKHIDNFCGEVPDQYYIEDSTGVSVAKFDNTPDQGLTTFVSIGLSSHLLIQESGKSIRQELLVTTDNEYSDLAIEDIIFSVAKLMIASHEPVMRGQVIGPRGLLFPEIPESKLTSLLCSYPAFFPEEFSFFENVDTTVLVELIPVQSSEAQYIELEGWSKFFEKIDDGDIDILNYFR